MRVGDLTCETEPRKPHKRMAFVRACDPPLFQARPPYPATFGPPPTGWDGFAVRSSRCQAEKIIPKSCCILRARLFIIIFGLFSVPAPPQLWLRRGFFITLGAGFGNLPASIHRRRLWQPRSSPEPIDSRFAACLFSRRQRAQLPARLCREFTETSCAHLRQCDSPIGHASRNVV